MQQSLMTDVAVLEGLFGPSGRKCTFQVSVSILSELWSYLFLDLSVTSLSERLGGERNELIWRLRSVDEFDEERTYNEPYERRCVVQAHFKVMPFFFFPPSPYDTMEAELSP